MVLIYMGLSGVTAKSIFKYKKEILFTVILHKWEASKLNMMLQLQSMTNVV